MCVLFSFDVKNMKGLDLVIASANSNYIKKITKARNSSYLKLNF